MAALFAAMQTRRAWVPGECMALPLNDRRQDHATRQGPWGKRQHNGQLTTDIGQPCGTFR